MAIDLTAPWDLADIVFVIEGKKLYVNKTILMISSDVFRTMFTADFREKDQTEIPLPGKKFDSFLLFMKVIHPPNMEVNCKNVLQLLPLVHEYGIHHVTSACEKVLLTMPPSVKKLVIAARYSLQQLHKACLTYTQHTPLTQLERQPGFDQLEAETMVEILRYKVLQMEPQLEPQLTEPHQELTKKFLCELMSKLPSVENLVLAERYGIPQLKDSCIFFLKYQPLSVLETQRGFDKIKTGTLMQVLYHKVVTMEPQIEKLQKLEREVTSAESILTQVASLERSEKQSQTVCSDKANRSHTIGSLYWHCPSCELSVMKDIRDLCVPLLQRLSRIK